jgi:DnaJ like chaperone protein
LVYGKIFGGMIGLALGLLHSGAAGLVLALIGAALGHLHDALHAPERDAQPMPAGGGRTPYEAYEVSDTSYASSPAPATERFSHIRAPEEREALAKEYFARHVCGVMVAVARADGELVPEEAEAALRFFADELGYSAPEHQMVRFCLKEAKEKDVPLDEAAKPCRRELGVSERLLLLSALYDIAVADGRLGNLEHEAIGRTARLLGLSAEDARSIAALHLGEGHAHYAVLGLVPSATDDELKSAFRRLALAHHPDKVAHLGAGASERASKRFMEIKEAYDEIRKLRQV